MTHRDSRETFTKQLKLALKHVHNPAYLAAESPLASPYFLNLSAESTATHLGETLQHALTHAVRSLWGAEPPRTRQQIEAEMPHILRNTIDLRYHYLVLELRYVHQFFRPRTLTQIWEQFLGVSRAEFYRDIDDAIHVLGHQLLRELHPTFRPETPTAIDILTGRETELNIALAHLRNGQATTISGAGGVGKTSLGSAIAASWGGPVFWFTIRPTLNDTLDSLLYALGYFLHNLGAQGLWQALVAGRGQIGDPNFALGLIRHDLSAIELQRPLLCFDEFDRLRPLSADNPLPHHVQLLEFVEAIMDATPCLLIGQHPLLDTPHQLALAGLNIAQTAELLQHAPIPVSARESAELQAYTGGNPRLIQLIIALRRGDETISDLLQQLPQAPALKPLLDRLFARSSPSECHLLQNLAVFRSPAPTDGFNDKTDALQHLLQRRLVQQDAAGGVTMWPALRDIILSQLSAETCEHLHLIAAAIRAQRGEYTAAAFHFYQAGHEKEAVQFWFPQRNLEIERGQVSAALAVFQDISINRLPRKTAEALAILRAELKQLEGDLASGLSDLRVVPFDDNTEMTLRARELEGQLLNARGFPDQALTSYGDGLAAAARISTQVVRFRNRRARVYVRQGDLEPAQREAQLAQFEALNLQGVILGKQGHYAAAGIAHTEALALAEALAYTRGMAQAHHDMATLLVYQGDLERVIDHSRLATDYYTQIGDRHFAEMARINLAATMIQAERFAEAVSEARLALTFFEMVGDPYGQATAAANLAEALCELGQLEEAQHYAHLVLRFEEPHTIPYALFTLGSVARKSGDSAEAMAFFTASAEQGDANNEKFIQAYALRELGRLLIAAGDGESGTRHLNTARSLFTDLTLADEAAAC